MRITFLTLLVLLCLSVNDAFAQNADPLAPVTFLEGGTWISEGKWSEGSVLRVEVRYF